MEGKEEQKTQALKRKREAEYARDKEILLGLSDSDEEDYSAAEDEVLADPEEITEKGSRKPVLSRRTLERCKRTNKQRLKVVAHEAHEAFGRFCDALDTIKERSTRNDKRIASHMENKIFNLKECAKEWKKEAIAYKDTLEQRVTQFYAFLGTKGLTEEFDEYCRP